MNKENIPIYVRIAEGIKNHILTGDFMEGEQLTSTRKISEDNNINIATANKAVNELVKENLVIKRRGIGMFVAEGAVDKLIAERRHVFRKKYIEAALAEAKLLRYGVEDLQRMVSEVYEEEKLREKRGRLR